MSSHTAETRLGLIGKLLLDGEMTCETGLTPSFHSISF